VKLAPILKRGGRSVTLGIEWSAPAAGGRFPVRLLLQQMHTKTKGNHTNRKKFHLHLMWNVYGGTIVLSLRLDLVDLDIGFFDFSSLNSPDYILML
jgi:hypothetical protein